MLLLALAALTLPAAFQEPAPEPLPPGMVARAGERLITDEEYREYLWIRFGKRAVRDLVTDILVQREAERYGIQLTDEDIATAVDERIAAARTSARGDLETELMRNGQNLAMFRRALALELRRDLLAGALVRETRVATDERLQQAFEAQYGADGLVLTVRHMLFMPNVLRAERIRAGVKAVDIDPEQLKAEAREMAAAARARILGGGDFAAVCAEVSHDRVTKDQGGKLPRYDGRLYGPAFRTALDGLQAGGISEVVESGAGFHVVQLLARVETRFEDVREQLVGEILAAEPTWQEKQALMQALQTAADVQMW
ncbi:MAG TPA: peptidylprolyl isomerase [Planctomycetota bacterium]